MLAGHSFGGLYILTFAASYPDQVAGRGLLDSTAPASGPTPPTKTGSYDMVGRISALLPAVAHLGVTRLYGQSAYGTLHRSRDEARARSATVSDLASFLNEFLEGSAATHQAASLVDLADKPLIVLTAGREHDAAWLAAQDKLATLSTNSSPPHCCRRRTRPRWFSTQAMRPSASQAIRDVVASVRTFPHHSTNR